jgi:hypothetical protein
MSEIQITFNYHKPSLIKKVKVYKSSSGSCEGKLFDILPKSKLKVRGKKVTCIITDKELGEHYYHTSVCCGKFEVESDVAFNKESIYINSKISQIDLFEMKIYLIFLKAQNELDLLRKNPLGS